jgi:hypothetical protein
MRDLKGKTGVLALLLAASWGCPAAEVDLKKLPPPAERKGLTYQTDVRPVFEASCVRCHGGEKPKAGLRLDTLAGVLQGSKDGKVITSGNSEKSQLVIAVARLDPETAMPPTPKPGQFRGGRPPGGPPEAGAGGPPPPPGGPQGPGGGPGPGGRGDFGPPPKPLTAEQVRADSRLDRPGCKVRASAGEIDRQSRVVAAFAFLMKAATLA